MGKGKFISCPCRQYITARKNLKTIIGPLRNREEHNVAHPVRPYHGNGKFVLNQWSSQLNTLSKMLGAYQYPHDTDFMLKSPTRK